MTDIYVREDIPFRIMRGGQVVESGVLRKRAVYHFQREDVLWINDRSMKKPLTADREAVWEVDEDSVVPPEEQVRRILGRILHFRQRLHKKEERGQI